VVQRGLDGNRLLGRFHLALNTVLPQQCRCLPRGEKIVLAGIELQDAARQMVVLDASLGAQLLQ